MMTKIQKIAVTFLVMLTVALFGCAAFETAVTPCYIDEAAIEYSNAEVPLLLPYTTLADALYVDARMDYIYDMGKLEYDYLKTTLGYRITAADQLRQTVFDPSGPIGLLLPALSGFGLGSLLISKPSDKKEIEKLKNGG